MSRAIDALVLVYSLLGRPGSLSGAEWSWRKSGELASQLLVSLGARGQRGWEISFPQAPAILYRSLAGCARYGMASSLPSTEDIVVLWPTGQHLPRHCHKPRNRVCRHACTHRIMVGAGFRLVAKMARVKKKINVHKKRQRMQTVSTGAASRCWATMEEHSDMIAT